jgi:hypothetical protein
MQVNCNSNKILIHNIDNKNNSSLAGKKKKQRQQHNTVSEDCLKGIGCHVESTNAFHF